MVAEQQNSLIPLARAFKHVSRRTVSDWVSKGLLRPLSIRGNGHRLYLDEMGWATLWTLIRLKGRQDIDRGALLSKEVKEVIYVKANGCEQPYIISHVERRGDTKIRISLDGALLVVSPGVSSIPSEGVPTDVGCMEGAG